MFFFLNTNHSFCEVFSSQVLFHDRFPTKSGKPEKLRKKSEGKWAFWKSQGNEKCPGKAKDNVAQMVWKKGGTFLLGGGYNLKNAPKKKRKVTG